ncbi:MAG: hypothetical protein CSA65_09185 [Proteobacteria bacterium]|nr:MAG: hypothetical protein CSB49_08095 [Pseudomonadota bacterium]PIE17349.1 MAG: hypothetical protein CSA65_09185 [Pseudomonadota bacterium]
MLTVLFLCAGIAYLGLLTGGEHRQAVAKRDPLVGFYPPDMPRYPQVHEVPAGQTTVGRAPLKMSYFSTDHEPARIGDYYAAFWRKRGFWVRSDVSHRGGAVAAVDSKHGYVYQVNMRRQGKKTLVFPSVNTSPMAALRRGEDPPVRLFKDSKVLTNTVSKTGTNRAQVVLTTNPGTLEDNRSHYRAELSRLGYVRSSRTVEQNKLPPSMRERVLVYQHKDGAEITIALSKLDKERTRVHITHVSARNTRGVGER